MLLCRTLAVCWPLSPFLEAGFLAAAVDFTTVFFAAAVFFFADFFAGDFAVFLAGALDAAVAVTVALSRLLFLPEVGFLAAVGILVFLVSAMCNLLFDGNFLWRMDGHTPFAAGHTTGRSELSFAQAARRMNRNIPL